MRRKQQNPQTSTKHSGKKWNQPAKYRTGAKRKKTRSAKNREWFEDLLDNTQMILIGGKA